MRRPDTLVPCVHAHQGQHVRWTCSSLRYACVSVAYPSAPYGAVRPRALAPSPPQLTARAEIASPPSSSSRLTCSALW